MLLAFDDARRVHHAAVIAGNVSERERTGCEEWEALGRLGAFKEGVALDLLLGLRFAAELYPERLAELCGGELFERILAVSDDVGRLRSENWELAGAVLDLRRRLEQVEHGKPQR